MKLLWTMNFTRESARAALIRLECAAKVVLESSGFLGLICSRGLSELGMEATAGHHLRVSRSQIVSRGLHQRCPNCGHRSLFPPSSLRIHETCPVCELRFDPGAGFWLGPWVINYMVTTVFFVSPLLVLGARDVLPLGLAIGLAVVLGGFVVPLLLYRRSWSWWLMIYFFFFPYRLPANGAGPGSDEME